MKLLLVVSILLGIASNKVISENYEFYWSIQDDLRNLNASCPEFDSCSTARLGDSLRTYSCHCNSVCTLLGTCCPDSEYNNMKAPKLRATCRPVDDKNAYFMVDRCPASSSKDNIWERLCQEEWNDEDDVMKLVPVTSLYTRITYKNYYCFRCHEAGDDFSYWNVYLGSTDYEFDNTIDTVSLNYFPAYRTWVAPLGKGGVLIPVNLTIRAPNYVDAHLIHCKRNVISRCSDEWIDTNVSSKCEAYMALKYIQKDFVTYTYRNAHCALCNFVDLSESYCSALSTVAVAWADKVPFSFTHLLDVNPSDGDEVGKVRICKNDSLWDPYARKCRKLSCALPGYVVRNGECTPP